MGQLKNKDVMRGALILLTQRFCQALTRQAQRLQPVEAVVPVPCRDPGSRTVPGEKLRPREGLICPGHTVSSTDPSHLTHTLVPLPSHDSFPSLGCLLPSAGDSSLGWESKVCWPRRSQLAPQTQPLTAKGCHPFSVHLVCLKTMKKNHSHLFASAAAVIYGLYQSPLPQLAPSFSPNSPRLESRRMEQHRAS